MKRLSAIIAFSAAVTLTAAEYAWTGTNTPRSEAPSEAMPSASAASKSALPAAPQIGYTESFAATFAEFLSDIGAIANPAAGDTVVSAPDRPAANNSAASLIDTYERLDAQALHDGGLIAAAGNIIPAARPRPAGIALRDAFLPESASEPTSHNHAHDHAHPVSSPRSGGIESPTIAASIEPVFAPPSAAVASARKSYGENTAPSSGASKPGAVLPMEAFADASERVSLLRDFNAPLGLAGNGDISGNVTFTSLITLTSGMNLMPGSLNAIGEIHFHGGAVFMPGSIWHVDISAVASDRICVWNNLAIQGNPLLPITVNLYSINGSGHQGALTNFNPAQARTWTIAYTAGTLLTITGFDPSYFSINADAFFLQNPSLVGLGDFSMEKIGETLALRFTPVPEPGTYALMGFGLAALALLRHRRRRR